MPSYDYCCFGYMIPVKQKFLRIYFMIKRGEKLTKDSLKILIIEEYTDLSHLASGTPLQMHKHNFCKEITQSMLPYMIYFITIWDFNVKQYPI